MAKPITLKDYYRETQVFARRAVVSIFLVILFILLLITRMVYLQVLQYEKYSNLSDENRVTIEPIAPTRGLIVDRNGQLLADNRPSYAVSITKELCPDIDGTIQELSKLVALTDSQIDRFHTRLSQRRRPFTPVALKFKLTEQEIAVIAVNQHSLPGVTLDANLVRHYPLGEPLSHAVGYVGRINERELKKLNATNYSATEHIGKTGIEAFYEPRLHGEVGFQTIETDARGRITKVLERTDPVPGDNLQLFMDLPTQLASVKALEGRRGAVVAMDPTTGGILAFVSVPGFDPNLFVTGIDYATFNDLNTSKARPLFNRALQGQYPPGSTIKPIVGLGGVDGGTTTWQFSLYDPGFYRLENDARYYRDWKKWGHGVVDLHTAIVQSCDTYFYDLAFKMGIDKIHDVMEPFGFGHKSKIDLTSERPGLLPSRFWKKATRNMAWFPGETLITGIGQGYMLATPLQLALSTAILANHGVPVQPRMVKAIGGIPQPKPEAGPAIKLNHPENWDRIIQTMRDVVHSKHGTARSISKNLTGYDIAGKTGTAQVLGIKQDEEYDAEKLTEWHRDHALFVGFAPVVNPQIAVAVLVENGGGGGSTAAPVARQVMDAYFHSLDEDAAVPTSRAVQQP
ncbi:penicillin-binding protein 2 [Ketobacter sp. MCCC 1A13808]|uniref:penicillin-binding protein 2 n=1 Tax=Ketobacter sp. MCCC 1A13808 TaxID=2602738 RepID=UPI000F2ABB95|nr:penicillin-binding protein 2 [Ketobacter sp. MCCC 1A13808]MVF13343.1 penicillin-binding protein 2 [Ketobacter sp. MCCC 1A13808]RLP54327.1 MAG: penicillin-binding protein 2 [Ketobacter sp.]